MVGLPDEVRRQLDLDRRLAALEQDVATPYSRLAERVQRQTDLKDSEVDERLIDAKLQASEARTDAKFAELRGAIATLQATVDAKPSRFDLGLAVLAIVAALVAFLTWGNDRLALGVGLADSRQAQLERDGAQDNRAQEIDRKLDVLIDRENGSKFKGR